MRSQGEGASDVKREILHRAHEGADTGDPALTRIAINTSAGLPRIWQGRSTIRYQHPAGGLQAAVRRSQPDRAGDAMEMLSLIKQELDNDDLGRSFYNRLISQSPVKLIDFDRPWMNVFHCTGEFTCKNGLDEFRPDVTLFVNGLPLAFLEVKKPNNRGGMIAESKRMNLQRFPNRRFRRFINITQLMLFSNNMEYDACGGITPIQGVFYCTAARGNTKFSTFREENPGNAKVAPFNAHYSYEPIDSEIERWILDEFNCQVIRNTPEYQTNMDVNTPTNRVLTSMCSPERFLFLLRYASPTSAWNGKLTAKSSRPTRSTSCATSSSLRRLPSEKSLTKALRPASSGIRRAAENHCRWYSMPICCKKLWIAPPSL